MNLVPALLTLLYILVASVMSAVLAWKMPGTWLSTQSFGVTLLVGVTPLLLVFLLIAIEGVGILYSLKNKNDTVE